jgi:hypothetical protein
MTHAVRSTTREPVARVGRRLKEEVHDAPADCTREHGNARTARHRLATEVSKYCARAAQPTSRYSPRRDSAPFHSSATPATWIGAGRSGFIPFRIGNLRDHQTTFPRNTSATHAPVTQARLDSPRTGCSDKVTQDELEVLPDVEREYRQLKRRSARLREDVLSELGRGAPAEDGRLSARVVSRATKRAGAGRQGPRRRSRPLVFSLVKRSETSEPRGIERAGGELIFPRGILVELLESQIHKRTTRFRPRCSFSLRSRKPRNRHGHDVHSQYFTVVSASREKLTQMPQYPTHHPRNQMRQSKLPLMLVCSSFDRPC